MISPFFCVKTGRAGAMITFKRKLCADGNEEDRKIKYLNVFI